MTEDVVAVVVRALAGGTLVVLFALIGQTLKPKWCAGIFGAAPSVALASLTVTIVTKGDAKASAAALGMAFGAAGFVAFSSCVRPLMNRHSAVRASLFATLVWVAVTLSSYLAVFG